MYLLDTNVISELRRNKPHGAVLEWLNGISEEEIFLSAVTIGELQVGIERARRQDKEKAQEIEGWVDRLAESHQILSMDVRTFREWARLMEGRPDELIEDAMLAATARVHRMTMVTRNTNDFKSFKVSLLNPFKDR